MKKINYMRIASSILSAFAVLIILFCPILASGKRSFNFFSLLGKSGDLENIALMALIFCASASLLAFITAIVGVNKKSTVLAIILNGVGLYAILIIPILYIAINWHAEREMSLVGVGICGYILITIISILMLTISEIPFEKK